MNTATAKQIDLITKLRAERVLADPALEVELSSGLTIAQASTWITRLFAAPRRTVPIAAGDKLAELFEAVECSRYAVPTEGMMIPGVALPKGLIFLEVRLWKGRKYLNQLHGAPGSAWRSRFRPDATAALLRVIAGKHVEYARMYGEHFGCCGRCGADLTDEASRQYMLGPTCRKAFGIRA